MVYILAVEFLPRVEAWAATAVLATSYHHVWFSQNARGFTLMGFLTLLATYFLLRAGRTGARRDYAIYALACAAGIYTHLTMAFVVAGHVVVLLAGHALSWRPAVAQPLAPTPVGLDRRRHHLRSRVRPVRAGHHCADGP